MLPQQLHENDIATLVVDVAFKVHSVLGPGLLESVYEAAMAYEFDKRGIRYQRQLPCVVPYEDVILHHDGFRMDFLVESKVIRRSQICRDCGQSCPQDSDDIS